MQKISAFELLTKIFEEHECTTVFTIPGSLSPLLKEFSDAMFEMYSAPHEEHLGYAAKGFSSVTQRATIVLVTQGAGATSCPIKSIKIYKKI